MPCYFNYTQKHIIYVCCMICINLPKYISNSFWIADFLPPKTYTRSILQIKSRFQMDKKNFQHKENLALLKYEKSWTIQDTFLFYRSLRPFRITFLFYVSFSHMNGNEGNVLKIQQIRSLSLEIIKQARLEHRTETLNKEKGYSQQLCQPLHTRR